MASFADRYREAGSLEDAVRIFGEAAECFRGRIERTRSKAADVYAGVTPEGPYVEFGAHYFEVEPRKARPWEDTPNKAHLAGSLWHCILNLEMLPRYDYVPSVGLPDLGGSGFVASLFGTEYINLGANGIKITRHAIGDMSEVGRLRQPDVGRDGRFKRSAECAGFIAESLGDALGDTVEITYPQLQGPSTNALRVVPEEAGLMAVKEDPRRMESLALMVTGVMADFIKGLFAAAGGPDRFRPRARFLAPPRVKGLMVDDWISVVDPDDFKQCFSSSYGMMRREVGPLFLHTCGPTLQIADLMGGLAGLEGFETAFIKGTSKTYGMLAEMKGAIGGRYTFCSFGMPDGSLMEGEEKVAPDQIRRLSEGGRMMFQAYGDPRYAVKLAAELGL